MPVLLVVDDEPSILHAFGRVFKEPQVTLLTASNASDGVNMVASHRPDVVILDVQLPDQSGLEAFRQIKDIDARIPVVFITGHGTTDTAIEAIKQGAIDYLFKPLDLSKLREVIAGVFEISRRMRTRATIACDDPEDNQSDILVGRCAAMNEVYKQIGRVAPQNIPVLILGESGTGKELVARAIWCHSRRAASPFLAVNCAALPDTLLESELFGHEQGAFTGADRQRIGRFEQCSGGTLFLDEIGDMTPAAQAKILRVLQEKEFERVGGNQTIHTDVRLIAATNCNLPQMLEDGRMRTDLYYRLNVFAIQLAPLKDRGDDLLLLIQHFLKRFKHDLGKTITEIPTKSIELLQNYSWPGNVRQLQSVIKQAMLEATGPALLPAFLPDCLHQNGNTDLSASSDRFDLEKLIADQLKSGAHDLHAHFTKQMEKRLLNQVLNHTAGNQAQAAKLLGITRSTLRSKIRSLNLNLSDSNRFNQLGVLKNPS